MNFEVDDCEMAFWRCGADPGSREVIEDIYTSWACGFEEEDYRLDV